MTNAGHRHASKQQVPIDPFEGEFAEVVQARFAQEGERTNSRKGIFSFHRLQVVVEIEQERLAVPRFDEAIGMAVELRFKRLALDVMKNVLGEHLSLKMRHRPSF